MKAELVLPLLMKATQIRIHDGARHLSVMGLTTLILLRDIKENNKYELNLGSLAETLKLARTTHMACVKNLVGEGYVEIHSPVQENGHGRQHIPRLTKKGNQFVTYLLK